MELRKVHHEQIAPTTGSSFSIKKFSRQFSRNRSKWHAHPEFEIVYISNGNGNRHISNSLSSYQDGDLIFIGPNLPHFGFSENIEVEHTEVVIQLTEDFLGSQFFSRPEFEDIALLLEKARNGVSFRGQFKHEIGKEMIAMVDMPPLQRLLKLFDIMQRMSEAKNLRPINAERIDVQVDSVDSERLRAISKYIKDNFHEPILVADVAKEVGMTDPAFCRFFKKLTKKTFNQFLNEYRIGHACRMIRKSSFTLASISHDCGYLNISNFNKQFKRIMNETPSEFRKRHEQIVSI